MGDDDATRDEYQSEVRQLRAELYALRGQAAEGVKPPPLRQADILRALLDERRARAAATSRATVRLARNAKGDVQPEVMVEVQGEDASAAIARARTEAVETFDALCLVYALDAQPPPKPDADGA